MADLVSKLEEEVTCSICHGFYRTPKVLGCLHRFCRDCLHHYIITKGKQNGIVCPECRRVTRAPNSNKNNHGGLKLSEWADSFPTDFLVKSMVDNLKKQKRKRTEDCASHPGNPIVLFCKDCSQTICHVCSGVDHRKCDGVVPLGEEAQKERARIREVLTELQEKKEILKYNSEKINDAKVDLLTSFDTAAQNLKCEYQKIHKLVSERERSVMGTLRCQQLQELMVLTCAGTTVKMDETNVAATEVLVLQTLKTRTDAQILNKEHSFTVPEVERDDFGKKRPAYDELFNDVIKKAKIEETKAFLEGTK